MKTRKPGSRSRRGFLARLAAVGTMLGGVVPELRAGTVMATPVPPPPTTSLPPATSAMLYSSAMADAEVKMLLAGVDPGTSTSVMPPVHTFDLGGQVQGIALPVKDSSGVVTAYVFYGRNSNPSASVQPDSLAIKILLKDNGTATVALNGKTYPTPPEAANEVEILYASLFREKYVKGKVEDAVNKQAFAQKKKGRKAPALPPAGVAACEKSYEECYQSSWLFLGLGTWGHVACLVCMVGAVSAMVITAGTFGAAAPAVAAVVAKCATPCISSATLITAWTVKFTQCRELLDDCLAQLV
jgi:hypothetical protein